MNAIPRVWRAAVAAVIVIAGVREAAAREDEHPQRSHGVVRLPGLHIGAGSLPEGRSLVPGRDAVEEGRPAGQGRRARRPAPGESRTMAGGRRRPQSAPPRLGHVLWVWYAGARLPGHRPLRRRRGATLSQTTAQGAYARHAAIWGTARLW